MCVCEYPKHMTHSQTEARNTRNDNILIMIVATTNMRSESLLVAFAHLCIPKGVLLRLITRLWHGLRNDTCSCPRRIVALHDLNDGLLGRRQLLFAVALVVIVISTA